MDDEQKICERCHYFDPRFLTRHGVGECTIPGKMWETLTGPTCSCSAFTKIGEGWPSPAEGIRFEPGTS